MKQKLRTIVRNKAVLYMLTRYATYTLSFFTSMIIATKLGPTKFGIWGYLMLILTYLNLLNWGIPNAVQVLMIQSRGNSQHSSDYEKTGLLLSGLISVLPVIVIAYFFCGGFKPLHDSNSCLALILICICGSINYFNLLYGKIYRSKNKILAVAFQQSSLIVCTFLVILIFNGENLLILLALAYLVSYVISLMLYIFGDGADFSGSYSKRKAGEIIRKGWFLFLYNSGFYFIIVTTKTIISNNYSLEEFGYFTFSYMLANAVYHLLEAFSFLIMAKLLDRFNSDNLDVVTRTIRLVRENYVALFHGVMYVAMCFFPILLYYMPKYSNTLDLIYLCCLTVLLYTNSFGYSTLLMARNCEKKLAKIALFALIINIVLAFFLIKVCDVSYDRVIMCTMFTYIYYAFMCVYYGRRTLGLPNSLKFLFVDSFPFRLLVPYLCAVMVAFFHFNEGFLLPLLCFLLLNHKTIIVIYKNLKVILFNPKSIDI